MVANRTIKEKRSYQSLYLVLNCLLLLCTLSHASHLRAGELDKPVCFPLGVADVHEQIGYMLNLAKGINAIDLRSGNLLWNTDVATRPLIAFKKSLIAGAVGNKSNILTILLLDGSNGRPKLRSNIEFPAWVTVNPVDSPSFAVQAFLQKGDQRSELLLKWQAHLRYKGGANPPPFIEQRDTKDAAGEITVDLKSGKVITMLPTVISSFGDNAASQDKGLIAMTHEKGVRDACLILGRLYYLVEIKPEECLLRAKALNSSKTLWEHRLPCTHASRPPVLVR